MHRELSVGLSHHDSTPAQKVGQVSQELCPDIFQIVRLRTSSYEVCFCTVWTIITQHASVPSNFQIERTSVDVEVTSEMLETKKHWCIQASEFWKVLVHLPQTPPQHVHSLSHAGGLVSGGGYAAGRYAEHTFADFFLAKRETHRFPQETKSCVHVVSFNIEICHLKDKLLAFVVQVLDNHKLVQEPGCGPHDEVAGPSKVASPC